MLQKQISVFIENKTGRLADVIKIIGDSGIDLSALSIADTTDFGILRIIVDNPILAEQMLKEKGFAVSITEVIALSVEDQPGGLSAAMQILKEQEIGIEYMYAYIKKHTNKATVIVRVDKPLEALEKLKGTEINLISQEELNGSNTSL